MSTLVLIGMPEPMPQLNAPAAPSRLRYCLGVWNPSYEADALDAHIAVVLKHARSGANGEIPEDEVYVWWRKLRSQYRQAPLPHLKGIIAPDEETSTDDSVEVYLRLTHYRSPYEARFGALAGDDVCTDPKQRGRIWWLAGPSSATHNLDWTCAQTQTVDRQLRQEHSC